jgi:hypothetical protein
MKDWLAFQLYVDNIGDKQLKQQFNSQERKFMNEIKKQIIKCSINGVKGELSSTQNSLFFYHDSLFALCGFGKPRHISIPNENISNIYLIDSRFLHVVTKNTQEFIFDISMTNFIHFENSLLSKNIIIVKNPTSTLKKSL